MWDQVTIAELAAKVPHAVNGGPFGSKLGRKDYVDEGVPVIRGANLPLDQRFSFEGFVYVSEEKAQELKANLARPLDVVVTQRGTIGQVGMIPRWSTHPRFVISQSQMKVTVDPDMADPEFVYYSLRSPQTVRRIQDMAMSAGVPHINLEMFRSFMIDLPPLQTQRKSATVLAAYDELIENNLRRIEILEEMAKAIYREWFVNFRYPGHESVPLVDSPLGPIPTNWDAVKLGDRIELAYGKALRSDARRGGKVAVFGSSGVVGWHDEELVGGPGIVVGRKGNVGSVHWSTGAFYPIDTTFFVKTDLPLRYVYQNLATQRFLNSDAAVPGLNRNQAYANDLLIPDQATLASFEYVVAPMYKLVEVLTSTNENLRATRDLLLPRLISGELDVSELDIDTSWLVA